MLNLNMMRNAKMESVPYEWVCFEDLLDNEVRKNLIQTYPKSSLREEIKYSEEDKSYKFWVAPIIIKNNKQPLCQELSTEWINLIDQINSIHYRKAVEKLTGMDLTDKPMDVSFFAFSENNWVSPHQDKTTKLVSHLLYFNEVWDKSWGGSFRILNSNSATDVFKDIFPFSNISVLFKRSSQSWHMVTPIQKTAKTLRLTLQIEFWHGGCSI